MKLTEAVQVHPQIFSNDVKLLSGLASSMSKCTTDTPNCRQCKATAPADAFDDGTIHQIIASEQ